MKVSIKKRYGHFINGKFGGASEYFTTINPANEQTLAEVAQGSQGDVDAAVAAARKAQPAWAALKPTERAKYYLVALGTHLPVLALP